MKKSILFFALVLASYGEIQAQVTTSSMNGAVAATTGQTFSGATIKATHLPSGSVYSGSTNANGRFSLPGMRVGGPYKVEITYIGYAPQMYNDVYLQLGQPFVLNAKLDQGSTELQEVSITAVKSSKNLKTGAETSISRKQLESLPTVSRGLNDFTRLTPQADVKGSSLSIGGMNNRFNQLTIDGAVSNDVFGLNSSGTNGGSTGTSPISLDAIEQMTVQIAPFDVRASGFAGGGISAVTKSGTNEVQGSAYYFTRNQDLTGKTPKYLVKDGEKATKLANFSEKTYGVRVGGPLVKDKLFLFLNYERNESNTPKNYEPGVGQSQLSIADLNRIAEIAKNKYGYDVGSYTDLADANQSDKIFTRLDWNINSKHKLSARYSLVQGKDVSNNRSYSALTYANGGVNKEMKTNTATIELNSRFNNSWSNNLVVGYTGVSDNRSYNGGLFPRVYINTGAASYNLGTDGFAAVNELNQKVYTITNNLTWYKGLHTVTFGTHNEFYKMYNGYIANANGSYTFQNSPAADINPVTGVPYTAVENFERGKALSSQYSYSNTSDPRQGAEFGAAQFGIYIQDDYQIATNFKLTGGIRVDVPVYFDKPMQNDDFNNSILAKQYGVKTNSMPKPALMFSPRVGFNWDVQSDRSTIVRGGIGVFTSRFPFVWASGAFTQSGAMLGGNNLSSGKDNVPVVDFISDANNQPKFAGATTPSGNITVLDRDLKLPQIARVSLGVDQELPFGVKGTFEFMYAKNLSAFRFKDINLEKPNGQLQGADDRLTYSTVNKDRRILDNYSEVVYIDNVNKGHSWSATASLAKAFDFGLNITAAYTYTESKDLFSGTSSQNNSNFYRVASVNGSNSAQVGHSPFSTGSRVISTLSYSKSYLGNLATTIALVYDGQAGARYSYLVNGTLAGHAQSSSNAMALMYIPTNASEMAFVQNGSKSPEDQWNALNDFIESDKYLSKNRGKYAERNGARTPWSHKFDVRLLQDIFTNIGKSKNKLQLSIDIMNVGNLLSSNWGKTYSGSGSFWDNSFKAVTFDSYKAGTNTPQYRLNDLNDGKPYYYQDLSSRWSAQVGLRYIFN
ncbi:TonB-dependent receptor [Sphingobacteriaceae bacterium WQ 2009]|uniref:TonB-dependent receptor n=1 Tax=Rhinopithecimicrobium faecis TaxID=2820698 RepID=A0A8T4HC56_9SPHI|nr:TonB-dependent receptor [Sphingobacteriaceae bacterium WQ 2009]